jgi:cell division initiation protein
LKTAEDTGASVVDQANKSAELILRESQIKAEALINEARMKAKNAMDEADQSTRQLLDEMEEQLKALSEQYKSLQSQRDNLLSDLKRVAGETLDRVERMESSGRGFDPDKHLSGAKRQVRRNLFPNEMEKKPAPEPAMSTEKVAMGSGELPKSFFDDIQ